MGGSLLQRVRELREEVCIQESGVVVARLVPDATASKPKPWHKLRGSVTIHGDLTVPVLSEAEVEAGLNGEAAILAGRHDS